MSKINPTAVGVYVWEKLKRWKRVSVGVSITF